MIAQLLRNYRKSTSTSKGVRNVPQTQQINRTTRKPISTHTFSIGDKVEFLMEHPFRSKSKRKVAGIITAIYPTYFVISTDKYRETVLLASIYCRHVQLLQIQKRN